MAIQKNQLLLGAHISIAGGPAQAIFRAESIGCTAIQIFTKSNRQWQAKPFLDEEIIAFKEAWEKSTVQEIIAHASYLINIASSNKELREKSTASLIEELNRCHQLGIPVLVLHPGTQGDMSEEKSLITIAQQLDKAIEQSSGNTTILLETMAGQGKSLCHYFEQLASIYHNVQDKEQIGICADTCHLFAAGYDLRTKESYQKVWDEFDRIIGLSLLKAIHVNDSKKELNSRVDRHEDIGKGFIGPEAFRLLFTDERFVSIPKVLETPKKSLEDDRHNMQTIIDLIR